MFCEVSYILHIVCFYEYQLDPNMQYAILGQYANNMQYAICKLNDCKCEIRSENNYYMTEIISLMGTRGLHRFNDLRDLLNDVHFVSSLPDLVHQCVVKLF